MRKLRNLKSLCIYIIIAVILLGIAWEIVMDKNKKSIIIGFSAQLTGRKAELGVQERNGAQLAVEKANQSGGIDGRMISLTSHDDLGSSQGAQDGDKELIESGAVAIIGHATTEQTLEGLKVTEPAKVVMIGPTISTTKLSSIDDYFFRIHPSFEKSSRSFAKYIHDDKNISRIAVIFDKDNLAYSKNYCDNFVNEFKSSGGDVTDVVDYSFAHQPDFFQMLSKLQKNHPDSLLIIASDIDTAFIAQKTRVMNWQIPLFSSPWAQTETLISNGGQAVEGMELEQAYDLNNQSEDFIDFKTSYNERFGNNPSFGAAYSYESTLVLIEALKKTKGSKDGLKDALLKINNFKGLTGDFTIDKYGDGQRDSFLTSISNGKFIRIKKLNSMDSGGE